MAQTTSKFDAVIFDLDGVITQTALVHAAAWKKMFDHYLRTREERFGEAFKPFTHADDYLPYVDGKPRYKGVASFLESRNIDIPFGDPSDDPEMETVCGLGNRKNIMFNEVLDEEGVQVYPSSVKLLEDLKAGAYRIGVASSSKNCKPVLEKAGLLHYFETRIDGVVSAEIGLNGKPEPDIFTTACDRLGVSCHRAVVVEDAVSGVQAGRKGNFGMVLGVAREDNIRELLIGGADVVVEDIGAIGLEGIKAWFEKEQDKSDWQLSYYDYDPIKERSREALLTVGNGLFGTRGAMEESSANRVNYPGTYMSGMFNRLTSKVGDRTIENEDFVNISNWLPMSMRIGDSPWLDFKEGEDPGIKEITRSLCFRNGELRRTMVLEDEQGRRTRIESARFAGMHEPHKAGMAYAVTPLNYSERISIRSCLSADHQNAGVERYKSLNQQHLVPVSEDVQGETIRLVVQTSQSGHEIALVARHRIVAGEAETLAETGTAWASLVYTANLEQAQTMKVEKMVALVSDREPQVSDARDHMEGVLKGLKGYAEELAGSARAWHALWEAFGIRVEGDREAQKLLRLHIYHMLVSASPHHAGLDAGIPPRGLHGEAYRGHIFWDELYILPIYNLHLSAVAKSVLLYRYERLEAARDYARTHGYEGALFPWQSGSDGREETQVIHLNPLSGEWGDDYSSLQRHISLSIAYNIWQYYHLNSDLAFMENFGEEILLSICKCWVSMAHYDSSDKHYHICGVMGPDEFHEKLPGSEKGGLCDNAYSNIMVSWMLERAKDVLEDLSGDRRSALLQKLDIAEKDLETWEEIASNLAVHMNEDGIVEQFSGYFELEELDWEQYREQYGDIHRLDRILKAEGKSPDDYKLAKQADFLMAFYNLGKEGLEDILRKLGKHLPEDFLERNFDYYIQRTSHGSTLSRLVHARLAWQMGRREMAWDLYMDALRSDLLDIQGGTTGEGVHCGVMAGTIYDALVAFAGLRLDGEFPILNPALPAHWTGMAFSFDFRGVLIHIELKGRDLSVKAEADENEDIKIQICGKEVMLKGGKPFRMTCPK